MKGIITIPSLLRHPELNGYCSERMCEEEPTHNALILDLEGMPIEIYLVLCEKHAKLLTGVNTLELKT